MLKSKYWLALGGGGARWIIHIWIYKYLSENNYKINEISGTSMWAIVWSAIALWYTYDEIYNFLWKINFYKLADINLSQSLLTGKKIYDKLYDFFWNKTFSETIIPLKLVATDIYSWKKQIINSGRIIDAIMASISVPGVFRPIDSNWTKLLDWWLASNLPVLALNSKKIIAVSTISELHSRLSTHKKIHWIKIKRPYWTYNYDILRKSISISLVNQENLEIELGLNRGKKITLIRPDISGYDFIDFWKYKKLVKLGYHEAEKILGK